MSSSSDSLRPTTFDEYIGQTRIINNFRIYVKSALSNNEVLDHVLIYGPAGLGKTTIAGILANELKAKIIYSNATSIERVSELASLMAEIEPGSILFIDEIHRLPKNLAECLYGAMEDFRFDIIISKDKDSKPISLMLPPFTLVGATTKIGLLPIPFRSRFGIIERLDFYNEKDLSEIVKRTSKIYGFKIENEAIHEIVIRSRGIPRMANKFFKRVRDFKISNSNGKTILKCDVIDTFNALQIDSLGLERIDIEYLKILQNLNDPTGIKNIAILLNEDEQTVVETIEPFLLKLDLISKTSRGRILTDFGKNYLKSVR